ncbi:hypothetical protein M0R45_035975 [Rubus argutus]
MLWLVGFKDWIWDLEEMVMKGFGLIVWNGCGLSMVEEMMVVRELPWLIEWADEGLKLRKTIGGLGVHGLGEG